jgi:hypothetical protein
MERRHAACLSAAALLLLCWIVHAVLFLGADPDMLALARTRAVDTLVLPEPSPSLRVAVFAPAGEDSGALEAAVRARVEGTTGWTVLDRELQAEALGDAGAAIVSRPRTKDEAVAAARKLGVEAAVWVEGRTHRKTEDAAQVALTWGAVRVPAGDTIAEGRADVALRTSFFAVDRYRARVDATPAIFRVFLALVTILVLPVALMPLNELLLGRRSNAIAGAVLAGYTTLGIASALLLNGLRLVSIFWGLTALLLLALTALYTLAVLNASHED